MKVTKDEKYYHQQKDLMIKIFEFIGVNEDNRIIKREILETETYKEFIKSISDDIKKYYCISQWQRAFNNGVEKEVNILRNMCKYNNIIIDKIQKKKNINGKYINETIYKFDFGDFYN
jgi:hypothetical protein